MFDFRIWNLSNSKTRYTTGGSRRGVARGSEAMRDRAARRADGSVRQGEDCIEYNFSELQHESTNILFRLEVRLEDGNQPSSRPTILVLVKTVVLARTPNCRQPSIQPSLRSPKMPGRAGGRAGTNDAVQRYVKWWKCPQCSER